ncbi:MAG: cell division protein FtsH, partial [Zetaproteobacteria bacterium]
GGRAAEKLVFGHLSTGASDDLAKATDIARDMVMRYGMSDELGYVVYDERQPGFLGKPGEPMFGASPRYSEATAQAIDAEVKAIIHRQFAQATKILQENREVLERCARALLEQETLDEAQLVALTRELKRAG